jgi:hypothetical protein
VTVGATKSGTITDINIDPPRCMFTPNCRKTRTIIRVSARESKTDIAAITITVLDRPILIMILFIFIGK